VLRSVFLGESELTGATNLMAYYGLEHSYSKFSGKKLKEQLSSFLPNLPGIIDRPGHQDNRYNLILTSVFKCCSCLVLCFILFFKLFKIGDRETSHRW